MAKKGVPVERLREKRGELPLPRGKQEPATLQGYRKLVQTFRFPGLPACYAAGLAARSWRNTYCRIPPLT
jgi:hypothetical protein